MTVSRQRMSSISARFIVCGISLRGSLPHFRPCVRLWPDSSRRGFSMGPLCHLQTCLRSNLGSGGAVGLTERVKGPRSSGGKWCALATRGLRDRFSRRAARPLPAGRAGGGQRGRREALVRVPMADGRPDPPGVRVVPACGDNFRRQFPPARTATRRARWAMQ